MTVYELLSVICLYFLLQETDLDGAGDNYFFSSGDLPLNPPLKQRHHVPGRPVNSALMILFKSPHFSARADLRKSLMTG